MEKYFTLVEVTCVEVIVLGIVVSQPVKWFKSVVFDGRDPQLSVMMF